jgi:hypothetical protein
MDLLSKLLPLRVRVLAGDGTTSLGEGNYVGDVTTYAVEAGGHIYSNANAEEPLSEDDLQQIRDVYAVEDNWIIANIPNNPKMVLDSGKTVYGCQVWWEPIDSLEEIARKIADIETREGSQH